MEGNSLTCRVSFKHPLWRKRIGSFEMFCGYTPSISGLPKCRVSTELINADHEQITRRAINKLSSTRDVRTLSPEDLPRDTPVFYFKCGKRTANWIPAFVRDADYYTVTLSTSSKHAGMPIAAAYEDIRLAPNSSLSYELDCENVDFPRSDRLEVVGDSPLLTSDMSQSDQTEILKRSSAKDMQQGNPTPLESELVKETEIQHSSDSQRDDDQNIRIDKDDDEIVSLPTMDLGNLDDFLVDDPETVDKEPALWAMHSLLTSQNDDSSLDNP